MTNHIEKAIRQRIQQGKLALELIGPADDPTMDEGLLDVMDYNNEPTTHDELYRYMGMQELENDLYVVVYKHLDAQRSVSAVVVSYESAVTPDVMPGLIAPVAYDVYETVDPEHFGEGDHYDLTHEAVQEATRSIVKNAGHDPTAEDWYGRIIS